MEGVLKKCKGFFSKSRQFLMVYLLEKGEVGLVMKYLEVVVFDLVENRDDEWSWSLELVSLFFFYFEKVKDVEGVEELCRILFKWRFFDFEIVIFFIKIYVVVEKICLDMCERLF